MGGGVGGIGGDILRGVAAVSSFGTSELARSKPFQPGGKTPLTALIPGGLGVQNALQQGGLQFPGASLANKGADPVTGLGLAAQQTANVAAVDKGTGSKLENTINPRPPAIDTAAIDVANKAKAAANAVQTADAEARRARAAKRQSSVLGSYQPGQQVNAATLQPAQPRRSVLG